MSAPTNQPDAPDLETLIATYDTLAAEFRRNGHADIADHVQAWAAKLRRLAAQEHAAASAPATTPERPIVPVLLFDAGGHSIPAGAPDLCAYDLAAWVVRECFWNSLLPNAPPVVLTAILPGGGIWPLPDPALGACIWAIDRGNAVALFAQDPRAVDAAAAVIAPLVGGAGHA